MTTRQIWEIDDYNRIIDGTTKVLLFTVDTSSDDDPLPIMRKIAVAPAMYEALQGMLDWARRVNTLNPGPEILNALNVIAQAEGRQ